jgi:putative inorganic carbon (hco3(-)) transporter
MSLHTIAFICAFALLTGLTLRRSSWGLSLYLLTFYATPNAYGWGAVLAESGVRWILLGALIFAVGVLIDRRPVQQASPVRSPFLLMLIFAINASLVHFLFASNVDRSWEGLVDTWKLTGLLFLVLHAIKDVYDLRLVLYSLLMGAAFVGYEVVFHDVGSSRDGRLWVFFGGLNGNQAAAFLCVSLTLGGYLLLFSKTYEKPLIAIALALNLEVVIRCMSRGSMIALVAGAVWLVARSKGQARKYAVGGLLLGCLALFAVMSSEQQSTVFSRFFTVFKPAETRDESAQSRIDFWYAGMEMIKDHPLGSGYEAAFESDLGNSYIRHLGWGEFRSVHNGVLDVAAAWGIQGLLIYLAALWVAWRTLARARSEAYANHNAEAGFLAVCIESVIVVQLVASVFSANLDGESYLLWMGLCVCFARLAPLLSGTTSLAPQALYTSIRGERDHASFGHQLPLPE